MSEYHQLLEAIKNMNLEMKDQLITLDNKIESLEANITGKIINSIDNKFETIQSEVNTLKDKTNAQEKELERIDRESRKRNIVIFGVAEEEENGAYAELEKMVTDIITINLEIECSRQDIQFVTRMGKKRENKPRPILLSTTTMGKKIEIMKNKYKLESTGCYLKEDYPKKVLEIRKSLQEELKKEIEKGNRAYIKYDKLVILNKPINNKRRLSESPEHQKEASTSQKNEKTPTNSQNQPIKRNKTSKTSPTKQKSMSSFINKNYRELKATTTSPTQNKLNDTKTTPKRV